MTHRQILRILPGFTAAALALLAVSILLAGCGDDLARVNDRSDYGGRSGYGTSSGSGSGFSSNSGSGFSSGSVSGGRSSSVKGVAVKPVQDETAARACHLLVNDERARRGMRTLSRRADLDAVAYAHARDLLRMNKLTHISSDGRQLENRLARLDWEWAGENLARNKGYSAPAEEAVTGWVASPKHFENMFRPDFTQTGMAALYDPDSGFTYFVQVFITPV